MRSIRARIMIGTVAVASALFAVWAVLFYQVVTSLLESSEFQALKMNGDEICNEIAAGNMPREHGPSAGQLYLARTPDGRVSASMLPPSLRANVLTQLDANPMESTPRFVIVTTEETSYLVRITSVQSKEGTWQVVTARDQTSVRKVLEDFVHVVIYAAVFLVVTFGLASWVLSGAVLSPVRHMRARADQIAAHPGQGDLLPVIGTHDEIDELAVTLNAFLTKQTVSLAREKQMVSDASHELRTPLAALSAQLEIAHHRVGDPKAVDRLILDAQKSVDRLVRLASTLLDISRIESRTIRPATPFRQLVNELVTSVDRTRLLTTGGCVEIDYNIDEQEPARLYAVAAQDFGQVIDNLLCNAMQALRDRGTIVATLSQKDGDLLLTVVDDGPGMPPAFISVAFDRFSRPDNSRALSSGGSGLGLALVHTTVLSGGGTVTLTNGESHGLTVAIVLPPICAAIT
ncbi:sensor histidine kinase [Rathayibacter toxicus]|uniref:histidine kinase n=2 Tax=Rathayibacter toxicus TaxID=145458 RepID=A0A0C5BF25_9MICO|nr:hypothetical protein TI83_08050 [Rathayibacter toxicus]ALS57887.1 hypothetical protein APU90_09030 [Rathayibacter toxicus]KKM46917.1 hypothetical protein VT73_01185 [Rathayibacter toxicus]PPG20434.1 sensor histidine kinase [Rathayibacter toxicus]PPG45536.1 sensor histidine kinase [Rathayibacter toxicus]